MWENVKEQNRLLPVNIRYKDPTEYKIETITEKNRVEFIALIECVARTNVRSARASLSIPLISDYKLSHYFDIIRLWCVFRIFTISNWLIKCDNKRFNMARKLKMNFVKVIKIKQTIWLEWINMDLYTTHFFECDLVCL